MVGNGELATDAWCDRRAQGTLVIQRRCSPGQQQLPVLQAGKGIWPHGTWEAH